MKPVTPIKSNTKTKVTSLKAERTTEPLAATPRTAAAPSPTTVQALKTKMELPKPVLAPTREEIARRAYELYVARGRADGQDAADWAQAERELRSPSHRNN